MDKKIIAVGASCLVIGAAIAFGYSIQAEEDNNKNVEINVELAENGYRLTEPGKDPVTYLVGDNQTPDIGNVSTGHSLEELNAMYEEQKKARAEEQTNNDNAEEIKLPGTENTVNDEPVEKPCQCTCNQ